LRSIIKEACVESLDEAILAEKNGADRIELCSRLDLDGLTPNRELIKDVIDALTIPIKVMIRPREGDFVYNEKEIDIMKDEILYCKTVNVSGVVFGILKKDKTVDLKKTRLLSDIAPNLEMTFHKAIDQVSSIFTELDKLKSNRAISSILTSGGPKNANNGRDMLKEMANNYKDHFVIIPAGKITEQNINKIHDLIGAREYHGRKIVGDLSPN